MGVNHISLIGPISLIRSATARAVFTKRLPDPGVSPLLAPLTTRPPLRL